MKILFPSIVKKIEYKTKNMHEYKHSNNPELQLAVPIFEKEITECGLIVSAIEKQIPKEVTHYGKESKITRYACPNCGRMFWEKEHIGNYCDNCGQAIKYV